VEIVKEEEFPLASQIKTSQFTKTQFFLSQLCRKLPPDILKDLYELRDIRIANEICTTTDKPSTTATE
jgi:hypothetical protein